MIRIGGLIVSPVITAGRVVALAGPLVALAGVVTRPYVPDFLDIRGLVALISAAPDRWVIGSVLLAGGYALTAAGLVAVVGTIRQGDAGAGHGALPCLAMGTAALAFTFGSSGVGLSAAASVGADMGSAVQAQTRWETPVLVVAIVALVVGWWSTARAAIATGLVRGGVALTVRGAVVAAMAGFLIPASAGEYLTLAGVSVVLWSIAPRTWWVAVTVGGRP